MQVSGKVKEFRAIRKRGDLYGLPLQTVILCLGFEQLIIQTVGFLHQVFVSVIICHGSTVNDQDAVTEHGRLHAVTDVDGSLIFHKAVELLVYLRLRDGI